MKSKYLCPVCGHELEITRWVYHEDVSWWCNQCRNQNFTNARGDTEHLAYEKLLERVKGEGK